MGTTYKSILFIVFAVLLNFEIANAWAKSCTPEEEAGYVKVSELEYLGFGITGTGICVRSDSQANALTFCLNKNKAFRVLNPANPQYGKNLGGDLDSNPKGYYYCVQKSPDPEAFKAQNTDIPQDKLAANADQLTQLNDKQQLCNIANSLSPWLAEQPELRFVWRPVGGDGDCMCGVGNDLSLCTQNIPPAALAATAAVAPPATPVAASTPAADPAATTAQLNACAQEFVQAAEACKTESERAKNSCDESYRGNTGNNNSAARIASGATQIMGQVFNMQNQASGMQAECFRAGAAANTASVAIDGMESKCEIDFASCNRLCRGATANETKADQFMRECARRVNKTPEQIQNERTPEGQPTPDAQLFASTAATINQTIEDNSRICTVEAKKNKDKLSQLADGIGRALQSSVQCACQTAASGANCDKIPSVQDCTAIPQPAGCGAYEAMATCSVGAPGYNAKECQCMQNPASPGCGGGSNAISAFAGPGIANNLARGAAGGGVNFSGGAGSGRGSGFSLGANGEIENSDLSFLNGSKSGAPAANPVVGGGAAGAAAASNGNATADKDGGAMMGEDEKGIGGIFNQAKTFMSRALGLSRKPTKAAGGKNGFGKPDMGKFKPLRGLAGRSSGMGSRNMDIWKMMNACTSGDTCKSNENNYLITP